MEITLLSKQLQVAVILSVFLNMYVIMCIVCFGLIPYAVKSYVNLRTQLRAIGDGNCLFRCFSQIITGSPDQHYEVAMGYIHDMSKNSHCPHMLCYRAIRLDRHWHPVH